MNCGKSTSDNDAGMSFGDEEPTHRPFSLSNDFCTATIHELVQRMASAAKSATTDSEGRASSSASSNSAMHIGELLWGLAKGAWPRAIKPGVCIVKTSSHSSAATEVDAPSSTTKQTADVRLNPYSCFSVPKQEAWFQTLADPSLTEEVPNRGQVAFLRAVADRCATEARLFEQRGGVRHGHPTSEPISAALLAPPGTGKTFCIKTACRSFHEVLKWTDGVEFQCAASQNRMGARIDGMTLHSWGQVPIDSDSQAVQEASTLDAIRSWVGGVYGWGGWASIA